jgi:hypothetical protein
MIGFGMVRLRSWRQFESFRQTRGSDVIEQLVKGRLVNPGKQFHSGSGESM